MMFERGATTVEAAAATVVVVGRFSLAGWFDGRLDFKISKVR